MPFLANDREILRRLAERYMEIALRPEQKEKIRLWKALNRGRMERPMVAMDQLPWEELNVGDELNCTVSDPVWRGVERSLKETIYRWEHFPVDMVVDPFVTIPKLITDSGIGLEIRMDALATEPNREIVSMRFEPQIQEPGDEKKIKDSVITYDEAGSRLLMQEAEAIFDGIAPVRQSGGMQFHLGIWDTLTELMGAENVYYSLVDSPELLHAAMERLTQSKISAIEQCNRLGLHDDVINTCHCSYIYTDELLPDSGCGKGSTSENCWAFGMAQVLGSASPEQFREFELPYIQRMAEHFGMVYYGCCDRMDDRMELVKQIPHVRKISCSPWSNREKFAENIGTELVMSNKPSPAFVAVPQFDSETVRADLQRTYALAKQNGVNLEFILKDVSTICHDPARLDEWAKVAMEVVCR